jgi:AraC-like DNA-binding protein
MKQAVRLNNETKISEAGPNVLRPRFQLPSPTCRPDTLPSAPATCMHSHLARVTNWQERARAADYCANALARSCGASLRELERFFRCRTDNGPHHWLNELRQTEGLALIAAGNSVKETAHELRYKHPAHFSRDFKRFHGMPPSAAQSIISLRALLYVALCRLLVAQSRVLVTVQARSASHTC